jgi:branched-chain amino acid aminotransferase
MPSGGRKVMDLCYVDGSFIPLQEATLPVTDLIIQRGVGVFDSISTHRRRPIRLTAHLKRFQNSASEAGIYLPLPLEEMASIIRQGIEKIDSETVIRPYITGGDIFDPESLTFPSPRFFIIFQETRKPPVQCYTRGVTLQTIDADRFMPHTKSINYMISFTSQSKDLNAFEILYAPKGEITESSHSNFFLIRDNRLITAPLDRVLAGTTRELVLSIASKMGITIEERCPGIEELSSAEEAFITGSIKEILPVIKVDGTVIGKGIPGPLTGKVHERYLENITEWLE